MPARSPFPETEKKCPPETRTFDVQALNIQTPKLPRKAPHRILISGTFCPSILLAIFRYATAAPLLAQRISGFP